MNKEVKQNSSPSSEWLEADNYTGGSCDQELGSTNAYSTKIKESGGWGSCNVNQETNWLTSRPGEDGEATDASSNSEGRSPSPNTDPSGLRFAADENSMSSWSNESTDPRNSGSEGDSSGSSVDSFLLEEDSPLAEIPLTAKEKRLVERFCTEMEGVHNENTEEHQKSSGNFSSNYIENASKRVGNLLEQYLSQGIRLNLPYNDVSNLVLDEIKDILYYAVDLTSGLRRRDYRIDKDPGKGELDNPNNIKAVVNVARELFFKGGKVELNDYNDEPDYERFHKMVRKPMRKFVKEREQIYGVLKSAAYEGIINKDAQVQKGDLVVDIDNCYFYTKYPQDSTIEVAKVVDGLKKVTNDLKIEGLNFKYYIFRIGESIVRFEEDKDEKRNYTDVLQGSTEMSFATKVGKISIHLYPSSTETENRGIKVEIDEESKTRFFQLEDEEKESLGKNCLLEGKSVADVIVKSLEKNGDVPTSSAKALSNSITYMKQISLGRPPEAGIRSM